MTVVKAKVKALATVELMVTIKKFDDGDIELREVLEVLQVDDIEDIEVISEF